MRVPTHLNLRRLAAYTTEILFGMLLLLLALTIGLYAKVFGDRASSGASVSMEAFDNHPNLSCSQELGCAQFQSCAQIRADGSCLLKPPSPNDVLYLHNGTLFSNLPQSGNWEWANRIEMGDGEYVASVGGNVFVYGTYHADISFYDASGNENTNANLNYTATHGSSNGFVSLFNCAGQWKWSTSVEAQTPSSITPGAYDRAAVVPLGLFSDGDSVLVTGTWRRGFFGVSDALPTFTFTFNSSSTNANHPINISNSNFFIAKVGVAGWDWVIGANSSVQLSLNGLFLVRTPTACYVSATYQNGMTFQDKDGVSRLLLTTAYGDSDTFLASFTNDGFWTWAASIAGVGGVSPVGLELVSNTLIVSGQFSPGINAVLYNAVREGQHVNLTNPALVLDSAGAVNTVAFVAGANLSGVWKFNSTIVGNYPMLYGPVAYENDQLFVQGSYLTATFVNPDGSSDSSLDLNADTGNVFGELIASLNVDGEWIWTQTATSNAKVNPDGLVVSDHLLYVLSYFNQQVNFSNFDEALQGDTHDNLLLAQLSLEGEWNWVAYTLGMDRYSQQILVPLPFVSSPSNCLSKGLMLYTSGGAGIGSNTQAYFYDSDNTSTFAIPVSGSVDAFVTFIDTQGYWRAVDRINGSSVTESMAATVDPRSGALYVLGEYLSSSTLDFQVDNVTQLSISGVGAIGSFIGRMHVGKELSGLSVIVNETLLFESLSLHTFETWVNLPLPLGCIVAVNVSLQPSTLYYAINNTLTTDPSGMFVGLAFDSHTLVYAPF